MKLIVAIGVLVCIIATHTKPTIKNICEDEKLTCYQTEYSAYVKCVEKQRVKRQACLFADSMQPQMVQPVQSRITQPQSMQVYAPQMVQTAQSPCIGNACNPVPASQVIIDTCLNSCGTTCNGNACRERCDVSCQTPSPPLIQPPQIIPQPPQPITIIEKANPPQPAPSPNVTTIIKLTNIVNNTNVVNVPTTINNTNINNLDVVTNSTNRAEKCCTVVQPKVCNNVHTIMNRTIYRCVHRRHNTCGNPCTSNIMHAQVRQPCNGPVETCPPTISYVPQPQPKCFYQQSWPYVKCGGNENPSCEGCYDHYGYGFQQYHGSDQPECNGCFDDGIDAGSMYRQGPFYRPGYYHTPPCHMTGSCGFVQQPMVQPMDCGMGGCFGHELIDPAFGMQSYSPYSSYYQMISPMSVPNYFPPYFSNGEYYISNSTSAVNENGEINENLAVPINPYRNALPSPYPFYGSPYAYPSLNSPYAYSSLSSPYAYPSFGYQGFSPLSFPYRNMKTNETVLIPNKN